MGAILFGVRWLGIGVWWVFVAWALLEMSFAHADTYETCAQRCVDNNYDTNEAGAIQWGSCINACPPYVEPLGTVYGGEVMVMCLSPGSPECQSIPIDPNSDVPTPEGWGGPSSPPATATGQNQYTATASGGCTGTTGPYPSGGAACAALKGTLVSGGCIGGDWTLNTPESATAGACSWKNPANNTNWPVGGINSPSMSCPAGYTSSGGTCNLTDAGAVEKPKDGNCGVTRVGDEFIYDPNDPDCEDPPDGLQTVIDGNEMSVTRNDGAKIKVTLDDGTHAADIRISVPTSEGNTNFSHYSVSGPSAPSYPLTIQGVGSGTNMGAGTGEGDSLGNCGGPTQPKCNVKVDETGTPDGAGAYGGSEAVVDGWSLSTLFGLEAWTGSTSSSNPFESMPSFAPEGSCEGSEIQWEWVGHTIDLDWCSWWAPARDMLAWVLWALFAVYAWRRLTGAAAVG